MQKEVFKPHQHIPRYSLVLLRALKNPLLIYFALAGNFLTFTSAYLFFIAEQNVNPAVSTYFDAVWWAFCTVSTVGYGDIVPMTTLGRLISMFLIIVGVTFFLSFMALLVSITSVLITKPEMD